MKNQRLNIALVALVVAILIVIPYSRGKFASKDSTVRGTLPLGLLLQPTGRRLKVVNTVKDGPITGLGAGDYITQVNDIKVSSIAGFRKALQDVKLGESVRLTVLRDKSLLTISKKHLGPVEVPHPGESGFTEELTLTSNRSLGSDALPSGSSAPGAGPRYLQSNYADFGMKFREDDGRLVVEALPSGSVAAAYGVVPEDILFQIDQNKITSLASFHSAAAQKYVGDRADVMLIRGESIVIIEGMQLDAAGVQAANGFQPKIYAFSDLTRESVEQLMQNPFDLENAIGRSPLEPNEETTTLDQIADTPASSVADVLGALEFDTGFDLGKPSLEVPPAPTISDEELEATNPLSDVMSSSDSGDVGDVRDGEGPFRPFNALEEIGEVAGDSLALTKPNAVPRFDDVKGVPLEGVAEQLPVPSSSESVRTVRPGGLKDAVAVPAFAGPQVDGSDNVSALADRTIVNPFTADVSGRPNDIASTYDPARGTHSESEFGSVMVAPENEGEYRRDLAKPRAITKNSSLPSAAPIVPPLESLDMPQPSYDDIPVYDAAPLQPHQFADQGSMSHLSVTPEESFDGFPMSMGLPRQPHCSYCDDWGCDQCVWQADYDFTLNRLLYGNDEPLISIGGWGSIGYHTARNDLFNNRPNTFSAHQAWLYLERTATSDSPLGFRADVMYGIDAGDTQAFGNNPGNWDFANGFDRGAYGWALPQLYAEVALGDWSVKAGHFYTLIGYEVVTAPDNFFYSHAMTMYNSEPFTHTGVVASRSVGDKMEIHAGWTLGWDTGFDRLGDGSSWLGGISYDFTEFLSLTYMSTAGDFGARGSEAYSHSIVLNASLTDKLEWIVQSDLLRVGSTNESNVGVNQYLLYSATDQLGIGARMEWWNADVITGYAPHDAVLPTDGKLSYFAATFGFNYQPVYNLIVRPEVRHDWSPAADYSETYFAMDAILRF